VKLKDSVIITEVAGEYMLVEVENESGTAFHGIIKLNETANFMAEAMRGGISEEALADKVMEEYDVTDREKVLSDIRSLAEKLRDVKLLED